MMAKMQRLRFVTEVAPPRLISVIRRPMKELLATIHEEESEIQVENNEPEQSAVADLQRGTGMLFLLFSFEGPDFQSSVSAFFRQ
ncbi:hypothetical protein AgCh_003178 [Apium graveolens]